MLLRSSYLRLFTTRCIARHKPIVRELKALSGEWSRESRQRLVALSVNRSLRFDAIDGNRSRIMTSLSFSSLNELSVEHNEKRNEFYIQLASEKAVLNYRHVSAGVVDLYHTEVPHSLRGKGIAALLAKEAFEYVKQRDLRMIVSCTYLKKFLNENPNQEYTERVVE